VVWVNYLYGFVNRLNVWVNYLYMCELFECLVELIVCV
jgi:hypothetical protein